MDEAMAGKFGPNPESTLFKPYYPYTRGLDFRGIVGLTIEAHGAILLCEGWMEPLSLDQAKDITIRGLTIDYKRRAYSAGTVVAIGADYFDATIESQYPINAHMPIPRVLFWDPRAHQLIGETGTKRMSTSAPQTVRVYTDGPVPAHIKGSQVALVHSMHFRPAILIQQADNIHLEEVTIHSQPGMGVMGHRSSNITLTGLRIVPASGSFVSTTTDATHFTSCTGIVRIESSQFEGNGDDGTNIHSYYYSIAKTKLPHHYELTLPVNTHSGVLDHPDVGDSLDLVRADSLRPVKSIVVQSVAIYPQEMLTEVGLDADLPVDLDRYYLIDTTRLPKVEIIDSSFLSHRARGALIKSRNVLIEGNLFFENTGTAIHVAAEGSWREGVTAANIVIRNNRMIGNGRGAGAIDGTGGIAVGLDSDEQSVEGLHRGLLIEGNIIDSAGTDKCISISQADEVEIRYNELSGCRKPIDIRHSSHVNVHDNTG